MVLELGHIPIEEIEWGRKTALEGTVLRVHREGLIEKTSGGDPRKPLLKPTSQGPARVRAFFPSRT